MSRPVNVVAAMRKAARHVPNDDFVEFDDAIGAVLTLIGAARAATEALRNREAHKTADLLMQAINGATP